MAGGFHNRDYHQHWEGRRHRSCAEQFGPLTITSWGGSDTVNLGNDTDGVRRVLGR